AFILWIVIATTANALLVYDLKWMLLPDRIVKPFTILVLVYTFITTLAIDRDAWELIGALGGGLLLFGSFYFLFQLSDGKWIGGGDVKIGVALGLLAGGLLETMLLLFLAS